MVVETIKSYVKWVAGLCGRAASPGIHRVAGYVHRVAGYKNGRSGHTTLNVAATAITVAITFAVAALLNPLVGHPVRGGVHNTVRQGGRIATRKGVQAIRQIQRLPGCQHTQVDGIKTAVHAVIIATALVQVGAQKAGRGASGISQQGGAAVEYRVAIGQQVERQARGKELPSP